MGHDGTASKLAIRLGLLCVIIPSVSYHNILVAIGSLAVTLEPQNESLELNIFHQVFLREQNLDLWRRRSHLMGTAPICLNNDISRLSPSLWAVASIEGLLNI